MSYGHEIYLGSDGHINNVLYPVEIPTYALSKCAAIESEDIMPILIPTKSENSLTRTTIANMIDLRFRNIPIRLMRDEDILEISVILRKYINELSQYEEVPEAKDYLVKGRKFYEELQRSVKILANRDPRAMKIIRQNNLLDVFKFSV